MPHKVRGESLLTDKLVEQAVHLGGHVEVRSARAKREEAHCLSFETCYLGTDVRVRDACPACVMDGTMRVRVGVMARA